MIQTIFILMHTFCNYLFLPLVVDYFENNMVSYIFYDLLQHWKVWLILFDLLLHLSFELLNAM